MITKSANSPLFLASTFSLCASLVLPACSDSMPSGEDSTDDDTGGIGDLSPDDSDTDDGEDSDTDDVSDGGNDDTQGDDEGTDEGDQTGTDDGTGTGTDDGTGTETDGTDTDDGGTGTDTDGTGTDGTGTDTGPCTDCPTNYICKYDTCIPDLGGCTTHDDCPGDSYCDADDTCVPYDVPPDVINDPDCTRDEEPGEIAPAVQCEWSGPPDGDPTAGSQRVYTSPMVADLNLDGDPDKLQPSIILTTWNEPQGLGRTGTLRVFDGRTCLEQMRLGGADDPNVEDNRPGYASQWAIADLDGDVPSGGHPEIVGLHRTAGNKLSVYAIAIDASGPAPVLERLWYGRDCNDDSLVEFGNHQGHLGPSIIDLDDDGVGEVVLDTYVFDNQGCLLNTTSDMTQYLSDKGIQSAVVDVDLDGYPELVRHDRIAGWDTTTGEWIDEAYFSTNSDQDHGYVAVVNAGAYSSGISGAADEDLPEVVVVSASSQNAGASSSGTIRLQALDGSVVWGPVDLYRGAQSEAGRGGPPTASDFDGDGQVEFATAGSTFYAVYDPDCDSALGAGESPAERPGGTCERSADMAGLPDGILWAQASRDDSSNITGSSVFDFNADGSAEAVYRDECYMRVYDGTSGEVLFSAPASNGTGMEFPVVADVDGDFATEVVVPRADNAADCPSPDPLFADSGAHTRDNGFVILRDPEDSWANSRPIWNQHAYSITHIEEDATLKRSSEVEANWLTDGMNNFRQNTQGGLGTLNIADLTVEIYDVDSICNIVGDVELDARVCNRGTNPVQDGVRIDFLETQMPGQTVDQAQIVCTTQTNRFLDIGDCERVTCDASLTGGGNVFVVADPEDTIADCHPGNNDGAGSLLICPQ